MGFRISFGPEDGSMILTETAVEAVDLIRSLKPDDHPVRVQRADGETITLDALISLADRSPRADERRAPPAS